MDVLCAILAAAACSEQRQLLQVLTKDDPSLWPTLSPNVQVRGARSRCEPPHQGS